MLGIILIFPSLRCGINMIIGKKTLGDVNRREGKMEEKEEVAVVMQTSKVLRNTLGDVFCLF